ARSRRSPPACRSSRPRSAVCASSPPSTSRPTIRARSRPRSIACSPRLGVLPSCARRSPTSTGRTWLRSSTCAALAAMRNPLRTRSDHSSSKPLQSRDDPANLRHAMAAHLLLTPLAMVDSPRFDVSVILPFGDDEEAVGIAVRRTAEHLRTLALQFEILAIDEDSGDNSHAVLALLRADVPELRVTHAPGRGRGVDVGVARAQGTLLLVTTPDVASASLDGIAEACRRLLANQG